MLLCIAPGVQQLQVQQPLHKVVQGDVRVVPAPRVAHSVNKL